MIFKTREQISYIIYLVDMQEKTPSGDEMEFSREFSTFNLMATYCNGKVSVKLFDYIDWIVYQKQFTETNIGEQINKKVDLEDLYFSLAFSKDSQSSSKEREEISDYVFGEIVKNEDKFCYKIQRGGKITAYTPGIDSKTRNQIYHESILNLKQSRSMTEMETLSQKMLSQKREHAKKFQLQLEQLRYQCSRIKQDFKKLEQQNTSLTQELSDTKHQLSAMKQQQMRTNQQIITNKEELLNQIKSLKEQNNKQKQQLIIQMKRNTDVCIKQFQPFQTRNKQFVEFMNKVSLLSLPQTYDNKFKVYMNGQIQYIGQNTNNTHYFLNEKILFNTPYKFKIKIVYTSYRYIMIGVTDYSKQKNQRSSYNSGNAISYYGVNGYIYGQGSTQGAGFSAGQTVQVNVHLEAKTIKWLVGGTQRASCTLDMLADQSRVFMPFVQLYNTSDIVQVCFD